MPVGEKPVALPDAFEECFKLLPVVRDAREVQMLFRFEVQRNVRARLRQQRNDAFAFTQSAQLLGPADLRYIRTTREQGENHFGAVERVLNFPGPDRAAI